MELQFPLPSMQELSAYYDSSYQSGMYQDFAAAAEMKRMTAERRLKEIKRHLSVQGKWLDVGCADGTFLRSASLAGAVVQGVELSESAVELARKAGLNVTCGTVESLPENETFDTITAFDVLEHVTEPVAFLSQLFDRLSPGGHLVLTLPDLNAMPRHVMGKRWYFYIPEEHLHYFNRSNLRQLLTRLGYQVHSTAATFKPLTFDYSLLQFAEFNPLIHRSLSVLGRILPRALRSAIIPLPIGEMMVIASKPSTPTINPVQAASNAF